VGIGQIRRLDDVADHSEFHRGHGDCRRAPVDPARQPRHPRASAGQVWVWIKDKQLNKEKLKELRANSPLGEILAAGLANSKHGREIMKECIEEAAARVIHELERYINALGTIAAMAPLLGLLGTVLGMIDIFSAFMGSGMTTNAAVLAGGISKALITTAAGLMVGIPSVFFHRFLQRRIDELVVGMEQEAIKLVEVVQGDRDVDLAGAKREIPPQTTGNVDINLASLIDVVFILLLFFVVTTTFTRETQLRVDLPEAVSGSPPKTSSSSNWTSPSAPKACFR
jgi:biopolymer transport protein ExbB